MNRANFGRSLTFAVRAGMSSARVDYVAPWWTYWLHNFPHINLRFQPVDNSFQPEEENYQQVSGGRRGGVALPSHGTLTLLSDQITFPVNQGGARAPLTFINARLNRVTWFDSKTSTFTPSFWFFYLDPEKSCVQNQAVGHQSWCCG